MRRFELFRREDESGVSGTGVVALGVMWPDGHCALRWQTERRSTAVYTSVEDLIAIHGHEGRTIVRWIDAADDDNLVGFEQYLERFKAILAQERGQRGRDHIRRMPQGKLLDALDAGLERVHPDDVSVDDFSGMWRAAIERVRMRGPGFYAGTSEHDGFEAACSALEGELE